MTVNDFSPTSSPLSALAVIVTVVSSSGRVKVRVEPSTTAHGLSLDQLMLTLSYPAPERGREREVSSTTLSTIVRESSSKETFSLSLFSGRET